MTLKTLSKLLSVCCLSLAIGLSSCRSSRKAVSSRPDNSIATVSPVSNRDGKPETCVTAMFDSYRDWTDVTMSVKCNLRSPKTISVSGKATMIRGESIRISFRMLGFEMAGMFVDRDSIYVYEKLNRSMVVEPMSRLTAATGLDIDGLQDLLLGRVVNPDGIKNMKMSSSGDEISLSRKNNIYDMIYTIARLPQPVLTSLDVKVPGRGEARCLYAPALMTDAGPVSPEADITALIGKRRVEASLTWSLETASWNKGVKQSAGPPKGYRRLSFGQLVKSLGSL